MKLYTLTIHDVCFRVNKNRIESTVDENIEKVYQNFIGSMNSAKDEYNLDLSQLEDDLLEIPLEII